MTTLPMRRADWLDPVSLVRIYVLVVGAALLLEGAGLIVLDRLGLSTGMVTNDTRHNVLHVVWGIALLGIWGSARGRAPTRVIWASLVFGAFYIALGVLGLTLDRPFGLLLGPGENAFHFTVGPVALLLGAWALKTTRDRVAALPIPITAPPNRRRAPLERKRHPRRGKSRRR